MIYTESFGIDFDPIANPQAVVSGPDVRFTVLTPRLLRLEYSADGVFEDRPSQVFWYRHLPVPPFAKREVDGSIEIETEYLLLRYQISSAGFTPDTLSITLKESATTWRYGQDDPLNLMGTARTLDNVDGALALEQGLMSRQGWSVYDDSSSLVFDDHGWLEPRTALDWSSFQNAGEGQSSPKLDQSPSTRDLYFFGHGRDFRSCLHDFTAAAGAAPMLPRWALGNWWSRYWAYSDRELLDLMDEFRDHDVPLSVCIVDMDWHITDTGNASSGWTGYTWNRDLFPDPPAFIDELHRRNLKTALNLHPADGVHPHEEQYEAKAERLGLDPQEKTPIPFDIADPHFTSAYFELLHHPYEEQGVDFWWMDWQQGTASGMAGLDPLFWLNHLHFYDLARHGEKRPFIFSRWGGLGNHRYPIGFSGDALVTWESLAFQPYFTATAANVNYGWWSHDIGGHMGGIEEPELFARWVQFGVFSPIFRLHSTNNPFHERRPWGYDAQTEAVTSEAMRLRHALIPYIYTMAWRNHTDDAPLVRPMYHDHPLQEPAYHCPDQYCFGSELVVAPFNAPAASQTRLSRQVVWLPQGDRDGLGLWFDFFTGDRYPGDGWYALYGRLQDIPVFARAGAVVPLAAGSSRRGTGNPEFFALHLFPGADNVFVLYEDDGLAKECRTSLRLEWSPQNWQISVDPTEGEYAFLPQERSFELHLRGIVQEADITAELDGRLVAVTSEYDAATVTLKLSSISKKNDQSLTVLVQPRGDSLLRDEDYRLAVCRRLVSAFRMESWQKQHLYRDLTAVIAQPNLLAGYELALSADQMRALVEVITSSGAHRSSVRRAKEEAVVLWNNNEDDAVSFRFAAEDLSRRSQVTSGVLPRFAVLHVGEDLLRFQTGNQPGAGQITIAEWFDHLEDSLGNQLDDAMPAIVQFDIQGDQGRAAYLTLAEGDEAQLAAGRHEQPDVTLTAGSADWLALINGLVTPQEAFLSGRLKVAGDLTLVLQLAESINVAPPSLFLADRWRLSLTADGMPLGYWGMRIHPFGYKAEIS
jgi:alpha-glucosidase (family GH31 glycosyl hydrolase)/putative sterol carrier protein